MVLALVLGLQIFYIPQSHALVREFNLPHIKLNKIVAGMDWNIKGYTKYSAHKYKWSTRQYKCLVTLWNKESHWNYKARNYSSGAYGIPQALPASKMESAGKDWRVNPITQIKWGMRYIYLRYGNPCTSLWHEDIHGWY